MEDLALGGCEDDERETLVYDLKLEVRSEAQLLF